MLVDFSTVEGRAEFIQNAESGMYNGKNVNGEEVWIYLKNGEGMDIKTRHHGKPRWWEVIEYGADGYQVSLSYESAVE